MHVEVGGWIGHGVSWWSHDLLRPISVESGVRGIMGGFNGAGFEVVDWSAETLFLGQVDSGSNITKRFDHGRRVQDTAHHVFHAIIGDQVVGDT